MSRVLRPLLLLAAMTAVPVGVWLLSGSSVVHAQQAAGAGHTGPTPHYIKGEFRGVTKPLAELAPAPDENGRIVVTSPGSGGVQGVAMPGPTVNVDGLSQAANTALSAPVGYASDAIGDVGPSHYVQATSHAMQVFNKNGTAATAAVSLDSVFSNCPGTPLGMPIVNYDPLGDVWLVGEIKYYQYGVLTLQYLCLSRTWTGDATSSFNSYAIPLSPSAYGAEPVLGVWHDGYYVSVNQYSDQYLNTLTGVGAYYIDRDSFLGGDGQPDAIYFDLSADMPDVRYLSPADLDGFTPPDTSSPAIFVGLAPSAGDPSLLRVFEFDPSGFGRAAFNEVDQLMIQPVPTLSPGGLDVQQPPPNGIAGSSIYLKSHVGHLVGRVQYRNNGATESLMLAYTRAAIPSGAPATFKAGVGYAQLTRAVGDSHYGVHEDGIHEEVVLNRWAPSVAIDRGGNVAATFTVSNSVTYPGIKFAGRLSDAEPGLLSMPETNVVAGSGVQRNFVSWSQATSTAVDPVDGCTFWLTGPYYTQASQNSSLVGWLTRIASFKYSQCTPQTAGTLNGFVYNAAVGTGFRIDSAQIILSNGFESFTINDGTYTRRLPAGTYSATVRETYRGYKTKSVSNIVITAGGTTTVNIGMDPGPAIAANGGYLVAEELFNGTIDPGEMIQYELTVNNSGSGATTNLTGTLLMTGGVVEIQSGTANFGVLNAYSGTATEGLIFRVDPRLVCGDSVTVTLLLEDNGIGLGTVSWQLPLQNTTAAVQTQAFDGVAAPALPQAWFSVNDAGSAPAWVTTTTTPAAGANAVYANNPNTVSDRSLWSEMFLPTAAARLTFRNKFDLEGTSDGGLLEISIANGAWQDIITAGGSWIEGGYTNTLSWNATSPALGRMAWTGYSMNNTYQQTTVQLPAAAIGKYVRFRFRIVTDGAGSGGQGWWIDSVQLLQSQCAGFARNLLRNRGFDDVNGASFRWLKYGAPDASAMPWDVTGGVFRFYRATGGTQAVVFQETGLSLPSDQSIYAQFKLGNSMNVRRRISVLIHDSNFGDLSVCTFWLEPNQALTTYEVATVNTKAWTNATISFYAASAGQSGGGYYLLDDVYVTPEARPYLAPRITQCIDPNRSGATGSSSANLLTNGAFGTGTVAPWGLFGNIASQVSGGVFEFFKQAGTPAGVILQGTNAAVANDQFLTATFQLGNSSSVRQRVTVLLHDGNFADLSACTFWLPPLTPLSDHAMTAYATQASTNATLSVYPSTTGTAPATQWLRLDNASLVKTASAATGTNCSGI